MAREIHPPAETDLLCERCGYVLNGLPADANCPECGTPAADSEPGRRTASAWEDDSKPIWSRFFRTTARVLFRPAHFYRTVVTRPADDESAVFGTLHWAAASALFALAGWGHLTGFADARFNDAVVNGWLGYAATACLTFVALVFLTRLAARLTTWEATYRGLRLPVAAVLRAMHFHAAHYLPVAILAAATVGGYHLLLARGALTGLAALPYLYVLCAEVILAAGYLFWTYWIGMRNIMYANA